MPYVGEFGAPKIDLPFNVDSKSISKAANSILNNLRDSNLKKVLRKCKVKHALNRTKKLIVFNE